MANPEHVALLKQGVEVWNAFYEANHYARPELSEADFHGLDLRRVSLRGADLSGANLSKANLGEANLQGANLGEANLQGAYLREANLREVNLNNADLRRVILDGVNLFGAVLFGADLRGAYLREAYLHTADLRTADLSNAVIAGTSFDNVNLSCAAGLDSVIHYGPSTIGIDTIYRSGGNIPHAFLRGAGVPDSFITFMASLTGKAFDFYSCFISYATADQLFAERLYADLQAKGVRCWFAPHDIAGGKKVHEQIDEAIRLHEKLLLILSPASMASEWVKTEIAKARRREAKEKKQVLFPVSLVDFEALRDWECFDADAGKDSAREIREYFIPDFSAWETDQQAYRKAFDQLLKGLQSKADAPAAASSAAAAAPTP